MTRSLLLLALASTLPLAACATDTEPTDVAVVEPGVVTEPAPVVDDPLVDDGMMTTDVTAQGTLDAVPAGGLTEMAPATAIGNIDSWIAQLDGATFTNSTEIRQGLMTLKDQLQASPIDGAAVGETLTNLGTWTEQAAGGDASLTQLGQALASAGQNLTAM
ncbi:hypothetical protein RQM47_01795 [Rubrivirga sp. S365]|uniref:Uncharacterized protein n=1 Tax=Rubrivirga litoralis TaxID=3075598 RepID=A0ABU3BPB7_9BACT|nr:MULTISPECIES: hypothetical protein [unclassified Rubrivirga]MDT0631120.1 hypothetical protein [Rubrivirga sp. F394]MDT7855367.1 hypothetical protein [Rubrivirga sp. S365]